MSEDRVLALTIALEAVLSSARTLYLDVDELCEKAIESLMIMPSNISPAVVAAISEIESAADALDYGEGGAGSG